MLKQNIWNASYDASYVLDFEWVEILGLIIHSKFLDRQPPYSLGTKGDSPCENFFSTHVLTHVPTSYSRQRYRFSIAIFQLCACILSTLLDLASDYHQHFNYFLPKKVQTKARHADKSNIILVSLLDRLLLLDKKKCVWHGLQIGTMYRWTLWIHTN